MCSVTTITIKANTSPSVLPVEGRVPFFYLDRFGKPYHIVHCKDGYYRSVNDAGGLELDEVLCETHGYFHEVHRNADGTVISVIVPQSC